MPTGINAADRAPAHDTLQTFDGLAGDNGHAEALQSRGKRIFHTVAHHGHPLAGRDGMAVGQRECGFGIHDTRQVGARHQRRCGAAPRRQDHFTGCNDGRARRCVVRRTQQVASAIIEAAGVMRGEHGDPVVQRRQYGTPCRCLGACDMASCHQGHAASLCGRGVGRLTPGWPATDNHNVGCHAAALRDRASVASMDRRLASHEAHEALPRLEACGARGHQGAVFEPGAQPASRQQAGTAQQIECATGPDVLCRHTHALSRGKPIEPHMGTPIDTAQVAGHEASRETPRAMELARAGKGAYRLRVECCSRRIAKVEGHGAPVEQECSCPLGCVRQAFHRQAPGPASGTWR